MDSFGKMIVKTKVSFKEYVKLLYGLAYKKPVMILLVCVAILMALWISCYHLGLLNLPRPLIYQYLTLILISVVQPVMIFIMIHRNYYSSNHLRETLEMEFTQNEIKVIGESFYLEVFWKKMFKIVELPHWFLIYQNNLSAIIVPKKNLNSDQTDTLKKILKSITEVPVSLKD